MKSLFISDDTHPAVPAILQRLLQEGWERTSDAEAADAVLLSDRSLLRGDIENDSEAMIAEIDTLVLSSFSLCKKAGAAMAKRSEGSLIFLSSVHAVKPSGALPAQSITHGALRMFAKELALYYGHAGVRVNTILAAPMAEELEFYESDSLPANTFPEVRSPYGRNVTGEDVAGAVAYLLSKDASGLCGVEITVDCGRNLFYFERDYPFYAERRGVQP